MLRTLELQLALAMAGTAAFIALWLTLRRAAAVAWLMFWVFRGLGIALSTVLFSKGEYLPWLAAADALVLGTSQVLLLHAVWQHARSTVTWRPWRRLVWGLLAVYLAAPWLAPHGGFDPGGHGGLLSILFRTAALPANVLALALLITHRAAMDRLGVWLMISGIALQVFQNASGAIVTIFQLAEGWTVATPEIFVWVQILTYVALALGSLYLVLAESRDEIQRIAAEREQGRHLETLGRMAGGVAHDFNNVLTAIRLSGELAQAELGPKTAKEEFDTIKLAVKRGEEQVQSLLLFARGETAAAQRFDVHALIREMEPVLVQMAGGRHRVRLALAGGPAEILGDHSGIGRILSNLVVNARDAMAGGGEIIVATTTVPPDARAGKTAAPGAVLLRVTDTGTGISPDVLPRIFEPFYTTKGVGSGTGLGLTIVQTFVQKMGGKISVSSEVGRGTTFEIRLPLVG